ncbi:MAG TPA: metal ABC transporter substrate-binding protein [Chthoniobacterales bacterium]
MLKRLVPFFVVLLLCSGFMRAEERIRVVSLSTVLTEIAQKVGADRVDVVNLIPAGTDPHEFQPTPSDMVSISNAGLILASGRHMEGYLAKLPESSGTRAAVVAVGDRISNPVLTDDPHWWHSIKNVQEATEIVRSELSRISPINAPFFAENAAAYNTSLDALAKWARVKLAELPRDRRKLVTSHTAFQYYGPEFGFTLFGVDGVRPEDEPSNQKIAKLIDTIRSENVRAVFVEIAANPKVMNEITRETGAKVGGAMYADGLAATGAEATYEGMMKHNLTVIVDSLK